jgi:hypothetical protein
MSKFLTPIDLNKNELRNAVIQNVGALPGSPVEGQIVHLTTDHHIYWYTGSGWFDASNALTLAGNAESLYARLASPTFTGTPLAPTAGAGTNTTQIATTAYVVSEIAARLASTDAMVYKGAIDASTNPNYPAADAGWTYRISVAGKIGGASGPNVEVGDMIISHVDSSASGTQAAVGANWDIIQTNVDGVVTLTGSQTLTNKTLTAPVINSPTGIVKGDVGLGNVDNTSDTTKNAASVTLTNKTLTAPVINSPTGIVKGDVGLGNVDNTSDANKPVSSAQQTALNLKANAGANSDITSILLNQTGLVVKGGTSVALTIKPNETYTAPRTLNLVLGDATRTLTMTGDASISGTHTGTSSGTNTGDQTISDTTISITDVTTNNASTTSHGFLKKLTNNANQFMDGTGNWSAPPSSLKYSQDIGDNASTAIVVTHSLGTRDLVASVRSNTTPWDVVICDVEMTSTTTATLRFSVAPTAAQYRVTFVG